jgi:myo-inositol-hexaphosphate 3-phosphohydrolase
MLVIQAAEKNATVNIFDLSGKLLKNLSAKQLPARLDFPTGFYVVELQNAQFRTYEKIQIVK